MTCLSYKIEKNTTSLSDEKESFKGLNFMHKAQHSINIQN